MIFIYVMQSAHERSLAGIDLNLLVILDALLAERHVTRAAQKVGLTQSATSHALARLRALLEDPLLVRGPRGTLVATPRAETLAVPLRRALESLQTALRGDAPFDPATARASFRIATSDYAEIVLLPPLIRRLAQEAPGIDLWAVPVPDLPAPVLAAGELDLCLAPHAQGGFPAGIYQKRLFDEDFRCVVRKGHPAAAQRLTLARFCDLSHALVAPRGTPGSFVDDALARMGKTRRVVVRVPHFLVAPHVIASSDLVVTIPTRIAEIHAAPLGLALLPPPVEVPPFTFSMTWHERAHHDPAQRWLRDTLAKVAREV
jgi:DNA-binding transcriptional LysR family regulator